MIDWVLIFRLALRLGDLGGDFWALLIVSFIIRLIRIVIWTMQD